MIHSINNQIRIFRDDVYPFLGGGNKGRKAESIEKDILVNKCNAIVTTGGIHSNHCRAMCIIAARNGWKCTLILHGDRTKFNAESGNAKVMRLSGAEIIFAEPAEIATKMDEAMEDYKNKDFHPYYVWGGGHTMQGGLAYINAVSELEQYCKNNNWYPEFIFHASGTGSTQAGILAGLDKYSMMCKVVGISVARKRDVAEKIIKEFYIELCSYYSISITNREVLVLDKYLCGGYEQYNNDLLNLSNESVKKYGFALDTTYSGKAFYGMQNFLKKNNITGNVLFWHTGGILNFLAN